MFAIALRFHVLPALIWYTDRLPDGVGGAANGPVVRIRPKYREDRGIHAHELEHVEQYWLLGLAVALLVYVNAYVVALELPGWLAWRGGWLGAAILFLAGGLDPVLWCALVAGALAHPAMYLFVRRYRLWAEACAYLVQMAEPDLAGGHLTRESAARRLASDRYRLHLTYEQALEALGGEPAPSV